MAVHGPVTQFSFVALDFLGYRQKQQFLATKTTFDVFKQNDAQSVAELSGVATALLWQKWRLQT